MRLRRQLAQGQLGVVHRIALRAEGGVAQTRAAVAASVTPTVARAACATRTATITAAPRIAPPLRARTCG